MRTLGVDAVRLAPADSGCLGRRTYATTKTPLPDLDRPARPDGRAGHRLAAGRSRAAVVRGGLCGGYALGAGGFPLIRSAAAEGLDSAGGLAGDDRLADGRG